MEDIQSDIMEMAEFVRKGLPPNERFWELANSLLVRLAALVDLALYPLSLLIAKYCSSHDISPAEAHAHLDDFAAFAMGEALHHIDEMDCDALCDQCTRHEDKAESTHRGTNDPFALKAHLN